VGFDWTKAHLRKTGDWLGSRARQHGKDKMLKMHIRVYI